MRLRDRLRERLWYELARLIAWFRHRMPGDHSDVHKLIQMEYPVYSRLFSLETFCDRQSFRYARKRIIMEIEQAEGDASASISLGEMLEMQRAISGNESQEIQKNLESLIAYGHQLEHQRNNS